MIRCGRLRIRPELRQSFDWITSIPNPVTGLHMRTAFVSLILTFTACGFAPAQSTPPALQPSTQPATIDFATIAERERKQLESMLAADDWPIRVFGLLRLERYHGPGASAAITAALKDKDWQVQVFALRQARQIGLTVAAEDLSKELDPHVIRAALREGIALPAETIEPAATKLLRTKGLDELMLGLEIAAASDIENLRTDAAKRATRLVRSMDMTIATLVARRLAVILNLPKTPRTPDEWRAAFAGREKDEVLPLAPAVKARPKPSPRNLVAEMDDEAFTRLQDYLDVLKRRDLDLVIVMDATASMIPMVNQARAGIDSLILFMNDISRAMRLGFVAYRDRDNLPVTNVHPITDDIAGIREFLFRVPITGGADYPEAVLDGFEACLNLKWNAKAEREIILVGDAPPHEEDVYRTLAVLETFRDKQVTVNTVHVPMDYPAGHYDRLTPEEAIEARDWLVKYNDSTEESFAVMARSGGGRQTSLTQAEGLVPAIMHLTIEDAWWEVFDEFYAMYLELCR